MRRVLKIARREYIAAVRTKGFIIGLVFAPVLMGGGFIAMALLDEQIDLADRRIAIVDNTGELADGLIRAAEERNRHQVFDRAGETQLQPFFRLRKAESNGRSADELRLELSDEIRDRRLDGFIEIPAGLLEKSPGGPERRARYFSSNPAQDQARGWLSQALNQEIRRLRLLEAGVDIQDLDHLFAWYDVQSTELVSLDRDGLIGEAADVSESRAFGVPMGLTFLMFVMVMMGAVPLINTVMEEKTQGIAEVVLGSVKPFEFMMGKVLGGVGVSLTASIVYIGAGVLALTNMGMLGLVPFDVLPWFLVFMLLAILMLGSVLASLGAACSDAKDAQNLTIPGMFPAMAPMFLVVPVLREPNSAFSTWASFFPPFTPMLMTMRMGTVEGVPGWQPWVGLLGVLIVTTLVVWAGGRIFRIGILMQGQPPRLSLLARWALRG